MALQIDSSTPAAVTGNPTCTTASFTPPDGSLLVIGWAGNDSVGALAAPTITDNLGVHLTYTRTDWMARDFTGVQGQSATWWAVVGTGAAMTVSVTNNDAGPNRHGALRVWVITGQDTVDPIGLSGGSTSTSASSIAQSYTATADNSQGFISVCDWDALGAETAGSGCTMDATGLIGASDLAYGFARRTNPDSSIGGLTTLNVTLPGTSTHLVWTWIEIIEFVGDPPEKDPPPYVMWHPPGEGLAPNGIWNPWLGTDNAAPDDTGLRIHESSPGLAVQTVGTVSALTTASFTPPAGSLLLVMWAGNSANAVNPSAPTITDSLGAPLTYTLSNWQSRADTPNVNSQAAMWTAPVSAAAPMTVTVSNNAASGQRHAALQVLVLINEAVSPVGAHGGGGSNSASFITQSYTAQGNLGQGFLAIADWDAVGTPAAGIGSWVAEDGSAGTINVNDLSYGFFKRTIPDDVNGVSNRLDVSLLATSTTLNWVYIEILAAPASSTVAETGTAFGAGSDSATAVKVAPVAGVCSAAASSEAPRSTGRAVIGLCSAGAAASGVAVKAAPTTGRSLTGAVSTGTAVKRTAQTGNASAGTATSGTARKVAPDTGAACAGTVGLATGKHVAPRTGNASTGTVARGTAVKVKAITGNASAGAAATHSGISTRAVAGTCSAGAAAAGTAKHVTARSGAAHAGCFTRGTGVHLSPRTGDSSAGSFTRATVVKKAQPTGQSSTGASGAGVMAKTAMPTGLTAAGALPAFVSTARALVGHCYGGARGRHRRRYTYRPVTGTTPRPGPGTIPRPYSSVTERP